MVFLQLVPALFIFFQAASARADKVWNNLLRLSPEMAPVSDPKFYIGSPAGADTELSLLTERIKSQNAAQFICRFPARYEYLVQRKIVPPFDYYSCPGLADFLNRVPMDEVSLVFASESLSRPASAMGHSLLKISGRNEKNETYDHAISFFTRLDDVDPISLVWMSFITGKQGFYTLSPYQETKDYYLFQEGRNVWEYKLGLNKQELLFLRLHLFELKDIRFQYLFHSFNCATLLRDILSVVKPDMLTSGGLWVTPLDLVRQAKESNFAEETRFHNTKEWLIQNLAIGRNSKSLNYIKTSLTPTRPLKISDKNNDNEFLNYQLQKAFLGYLFENKKIELNEWRAKDDHLDQIYMHDSKTLDFSRLNDPSKTPKDSILSLGLEKIKNDEILRFQFLPISHYLSSHLQAYDFQSEVKLFEIELSHEPKQRRSYLSQIDLFKILSLIPYDPLLEKSATQIGFGFTEQMNFELNRVTRFYAIFGGGRNYRIHQQLDVYALINLLYSDIAEQKIFLQPEFGILYEHSRYFKNIFLAKIQTQFQSPFIGLFSNTSKIGLNRDLSLEIELTKHFSQLDRRDGILLSLRQLF